MIYFYFFSIQQLSANNLVHDLKMKLTQTLTIMLFQVMALQVANPAPIIPLSAIFGKVSRSRSSYGDSTASIGPGLGGSPILVDTSKSVQDT